MQRKGRLSPPLSSWSPSSFRSRQGGQGLDESGRMYDVEWRPLHRKEGLSTEGRTMRTGFLLPLAAVILAGAGCTQQRSEESAMLPERDLTRVAPAPALDVASPLELQKPLTSHSVQPRATTRAILASRGPKNNSKPLSPVVAKHIAVAAPAPEAQPAPIEEPRNDRELLPGKTVTII